MMVVARETVDAGSGACRCNRKHLAVEICAGTGGLYLNLTAAGYLLEPCLSPNAVAAHSVCRPQ